MFGYPVEGCNSSHLAADLKMENTQYHSHVVTATLIKCIKNAIIATYVHINEIHLI